MLNNLQEANVQSLKNNKEKNTTATVQKKKKKVLTRTIKTQMLNLLKVHNVTV